MDDPMVGHEGYVAPTDLDDGTLVVGCLCGWRLTLQPVIAPNDPMRAWVGHSWRVALGMDDG